MSTNKLTHEEIIRSSNDTYCFWEHVTRDQERFDRALNGCVGISERKKNLHFMNRHNDPTYIAQGLPPVMECIQYQYDRADTLKLNASSLNWDFNAISK